MIDSIPVSIPLGLIILHFFGDFVFQTDWQAKNKSKNLRALLSHTTVYSLCYLFPLGWKFVLVTFITHTLTDAVTSRMTAHLWAKGHVHNFFVVIGADQVIHYFTLAITFWYLIG
jgi:hypothetical protein